MTKRTLRKQPRRGKKAAPKRIPRTDAELKKARSVVGTEPPSPDFSDWIHDALGGLEAVRRAFDNLQVHTFRGRHDLAVLENVIFHEELERVFGWLTKLDIEKPWEAEVTS